MQWGLIWASWLYSLSSEWIPYVTPGLKIAFWSALSSSQQVVIKQSQSYKSMFKINSLKSLQQHSKSLREKKKFQGNYGWKLHSGRRFHPPSKSW